jgi:hypothetical protein
VKCYSNRPTFVSTSRITEILCSDADFAVAQYVVKSSRLFSDSDFVVAQCATKLSILCSD